MSVKKRINKLDDVDPALRAFYVADGDGFALQLDDGADANGDKAKVAEFRENNRRLFEQVNALTEKMKAFDGMDPERYKAALDVLENIEKSSESESLKKGDVESVVKRRLATSEREWQKALKAKDEAATTITNERDLFRTRFSEMLIGNTIADAVNKVGKVRPGALQDVRNRAGSSWKVNERGELLPVDSKGSTIYGKNGDAITPDEWAAGLLKDAPYLFDAAQGGGGKGGGSGTTTDGKSFVNRRDPIAMAKNAEGILAGTVIVQ